MNVIRAGRGACPPPSFPAGIAMVAAVAGWMPVSVPATRVGSRVAVRSVQSLTASIARGESVILLGLLPAARPIGCKIVSAASAGGIAARLAPVVRSVRSSAGEAVPAQAGPAGFFDRASDRLKALGTPIRARINPTYIVHFGNLLAVGAMSQSDMLNLRCLMVVASVTGMVYNVAISPSPLPPVLWGLGFVTLHAVMIYRLLRDRAGVEMSAEEVEVYENVFMRYGFTPRQFLTLMEEADMKWKTVKAGDLICEQGAPMPVIFHLNSGRVQVYRDGHDHYAPEPGKGSWLGEVYDPNANAETARTRDYRWIVTMRALTDCRLLQVDRLKLRLALDRSEALKEAANKLQIGDLWGKIHKMQAAREVETYRRMIQVAVLSEGGSGGGGGGGGGVSQAQADAMAAFREEKGITDDQHVEALRRVGWTVAEWDRRLAGDGQA